MHMQGTPQTMQKNPSYNNVVEDIFQYLQQRIKACETRRIETKMLVCDPGLGFGKTLEHNVAILRNIKRFHDLGVPIMLGASRKSFLEAAVVAGLNILVAGGTQAGNPTTSQSHTHGDYACTRECQRIRAAGDRVRSCRTMEN